MKRVVEFHPVYGEIRMTVNLRARHIILRARAGVIEVTLPPNAEKKHVYDALGVHGDRLLEECAKTRCEVIGENYTIERDCFGFSLKEGNSDKFFIRYKDNAATLFYPPHTDFGKKGIQEWLQRVRISALRHVAEKRLPARVKELAAAHGFSFGRVSLRDCHTRWGSCSNRGNISLSIYLQLLPEYLSDYVILHELCHTVEMNHGPHFWSLMNKVTGTDARNLRNELKQYKTAF